MDDFLVIGGGIAGLSAAARLSALGRVTVLEAEDATGYHSSGRSAALFEADYGAPSTVALNRASFDFHHHANGGYLSPRGSLVVARPDDKAQFDADMSELGLERITPQETLAMVPILKPDAVGFAGYSDAAWDIDTDRMMQDFIRELRRNGGQVITRARISAISNLPTGWQVQAGDQTWQGRILVNAAGAWADQIAAMATNAGVRPIGLVPHRRSMARLPAPGGHDITNWPMMMEAGEPWYAKPDAGKLLVSPADADPVEPHDAWADDMVLAEGLARYEEMMTEPVTRVESNWAGLRSFVADQALVLGPDPHCQTFIWCAAQGGYGFQTAPAASKLLADLLGGTAPELDATTLSDLSPARFCQ